MRITPSTIASLSAIAAVGLVAPNSSWAAELETTPLRHNGGMIISGSNALTPNVPLAVGKSIVVDLPVDVKDVLVGSPLIITVVMRTIRRAYISGLAVGQSNVFFFDGQGRQISSLDIYVTDRAPAAVPDLVSVFRYWGDKSGENTYLRCNPDMCIGLPYYTPPQATPDTVVNKVTNNYIGK
jgi:hypothetical protein